MPRDNTALKDRAPLTITRDERDSLQQALLVDLGELGGFDDDPDRLDPQALDVLRLLADLDWSPHDATDEYPVSLDPDGLVAILRRLSTTAEASLRAGYDPEFSDEDLDCWSACRRVLARLSVAAARR
jgi:hypothetical protein